MHKQQLSYNMLLERSRETEISFSNLLGGAVLEEVVRRISESEYKEKLWLRNGTVIGIAQYKKKLVLNLEYDFVMEKANQTAGAITDNMHLSELATGLREKVFEGNFDYGISFFQKDRILKKYLQLHLSANLEGMQVPISVKIYPLWEDKKIPRQGNFFCTMFPQVAVSYQSYPMEGILAEKYIEIITKLELIQNIGAYYDIYSLLEHESVDGRKAREYIAEQCEAQNIPKEKRCLDIIAGYKNYTYMKKKWKVFLRSINSREPSWEMAVERFLNFFEPIWQAIMKDLVFFGDWMPELNRFL